MKPGATLVPIVAIQDDGAYVLACGHVKRPPARGFRPTRTQCRECFPDAPPWSTGWSHSRRKPNGAP